MSDENVNFNTQEGKEEEPTTVPETTKETADAEEGNTRTNEEEPADSTADDEETAAKKASEEVAAKAAEEEAAAKKADEAARVAEEERRAADTAALAELEKEGDDGADALMTEEEEGIASITEEAIEGRTTAGAAESERLGDEAADRDALLKEAGEAFAAVSAEEAEERDASLGEELQGAALAERQALADLEALVKAIALEFSLGDGIATDAEASDALSAQSLKEEREVRHVEAASQRIVAALARIVGTTTAAKVEERDDEEEEATDEEKEDHATHNEDEGNNQSSKASSTNGAATNSDNLRDKSAALATDVARMRQIIDSVVFYYEGASDKASSSGSATKAGRTPARIAAKRMNVLEQLAATNATTAELWVAFNEDELNQYQEGDANQWAEEDLAGKGPAFASFPYTAEESADATQGPYAARVADYTSQTESFIARLHTAEETLEASKAAVAAEAEAATAKIDAAFELEMKSIQAHGKRLKQVEEEQLYHVKRGTFVKEKSGIDHKAMAKEKEGKIHNDLCANAYEKEKRKGILENEIFGLKKEIDGVNKESVKKQEETKEGIEVINAKLVETDNDKGLLEHERDDLTCLKKELTETILRVRNSRK